MRILVGLCLALATAVAATGCGHSGARGPVIQYAPEVTTAPSGAGGATALPTTPSQTR